MGKLVDSETRAAIQALTIEHAYKLDHGLADTLHELYAEDGELLGLPPRDLIGREDLAQWGAARVKLARTSRHVETNHRLVWDNETLKGTVCATVYRSDTADTSNTAPFMVGDYEDEYVQEDGEWKFQRRIITRAFRIHS